MVRNSSNHAQTQRSQYSLPKVTLLTPSAGSGQSHMHYSFASALGMLAALSTNLSAANWPAWRGDGPGVSADKKLPVNWSTNENVRWRVPLPERANSSPIVWGNRVFVA